MWAGQYGSACLGVVFLYSLLVLKAQAQTFENGIVKCPLPINVRTTFNVTVDGTNKTYTKVNRDMLGEIILAGDYENLTTSCTTGINDMSYMFQYVISFNSDISKWDTSSVTVMNSMFYNAPAFNQDISNWDTSSVIDMDAMFANASSFNQNLSKWNTSSVTDMSVMFASAAAFNQDISNWDTSSVIDMVWMFANASSFNQNLRKWCVNIPEPFQFALGSPLENNIAFQPLWNGTGCTNPEENNDQLAIILGASVGGVVLCIVVAFLIWKYPCHSNLRKFIVYKGGPWPFYNK